MCLLTVFLVGSSQQHSGVFDPAESNRDDLHYQFHFFFSFSTYSFRSFFSQLDTNLKA